MCDLLLVTNERPVVFPALQRWTGGEGAFAPRRRPKAACADPALAALLGLDPAADGEIRLDLAPTELGTEGYRMEITTDGVTVTAQTPRGLTYGAQTLRQLLSRGPLPCGVAADWPDYPVRGYLLDVGRRYVTPDLLHRLIRLLGRFKLNELHLHLNDNEIEPPDGDWTKALHGFRLDSAAFPGLASADSYSRADWDGFEELAAAHGVTLIPEIDAPAHARAFIAHDPSIGHDGGDSDHLDLANPAATDLVKAVITEFAPWFRGPAVHFGADEYYQSKELWKRFFNEMAAHIRALGKQPRAWGGFTRLSPTGDTTGFDQDVVINSWNNDFYGPEGARGDAHPLINSSDALLYIVPEASYYHGQGLDAEWLYEHWAPHLFADGQRLDPADPRLLGAMPALWNDLVRADYPEERIYRLIEESLGVLAQKMWSGKPDLSYREFHTRLRELG